MAAELDDFRRIFDSSYPKLMAYVRRRADDSTVDDVVAETFLVAWRRRTEFLTLDQPLPWLYGVAGNQLRNQNRSSNRHLRLVSKAALEPTETIPGADADIDSNEAADRVREALTTLSFDDQETLRLVAWEHLSYKEAAQTLQCSSDAFAQRLRRAKQRLADAVTRLSTDPAASGPQGNSASLPIAEVN